MALSFYSLARATRRPATTIFAAAAMCWALAGAPAQARGPDGIADVAESVIDAVVNISTKQSVNVQEGQMPDLPPGSPMEKFLEDLLKNRRGPGGGGSQNGTPGDRPSR